MNKSDSIKLYNILTSIGLKEITLYDIGAEGGPNSIWDYDFIQIIGFEPDKTEYEKLVSRKKSNEKYYNTALSGKEETIKINVCRKQNCSSILKPNRNYLNEFLNPERFDIVGEYECTSTTIENIAKIDGRKIDILKVDTQGSELDILIGANQYINDVLFLEIETEFYYFYENQPTFSEIHSFMLKNGFRLFDMEMIHYLKKVDITFEFTKAEISFCNTIYFKDMNTLDFTQEKNLTSLLKQIFISFNTGFINYSYYLFQKAQTYLSKNQIDELQHFYLNFEKSNKKAVVVETSKPLKLKNLRKIRTFLGKIKNKISF